MYCVAETSELSLKQETTLKPQEATFYEVLQPQLVLKFPKWPAGALNLNSTM